MTPDQLRDQARFLEGLALSCVTSAWCYEARPDYYRGKADAFRQSARFLRQDAAFEEGFEVKSYDGGPRAVRVTS